MIDQCIYEVYKREERVIIPNFGAFIHSGFSDEINFNDLLNYDDGKVLEEIQKQMSLSEEKAKDALEKYVKDITNKLKKGKSVFLGGIGYLSKDGDGDISVEKVKSSDEPVKKDKLSKERSKSMKKETEPAKDPEPASKDQEETIVSETEVKQGDLYGSLDTDEADDVFTLAEGSDYSSEHTNSEYSMTSDEENKYDTAGDEYEMEAEQNEVKERKALKIALVVIVLIVLMVAGGFYYLNNQNKGKVKSDPDKQQYHAEASTLKIEKTSMVKKDSVPHNVEPTASNESPDFASLKYKMEEKSESANPSPVNENSQKVRHSSVKDNKTYSLILGSFKIERNADNYQQHLQSRGWEVNKFQGKNNFYFVGFDQIKGKSEAVRQLTKIREENPTAWIINKDRIQL